MQSISTKTGDSGQTSLANGQRVPKDSLVIELIGTVDELNSWLGLVAVEMQGAIVTAVPAWEEHRQFVLSVQDTLFHVGAEIALSPKTQLNESRLTQLEQISDSLQQSLEDHWHTKFLLPGGTKLGAFLDLARTVCRRAERLAWRHAKDIKTGQSKARPASAGRAPFSPIILRYFNRLSDYLYLLRTFLNAQQAYAEKQFEASK